MLGSKNRDYKTEDRAVRRRLAYYRELRSEYIAAGLPEPEAGKKAYAAVCSAKINGKKGGPYAKYAD